MSFGQSMKKLVARFIPKRKPKIKTSTITMPEPKAVSREKHRHSFTTSQWHRRKIRLLMARESRRRNR